MKFFIRIHFGSLCLDVLSLGLWAWLFAVLPATSLDARAKGPTDSKSAHSVDGRRSLQLERQEILVTNAAEREARSILDKFFSPDSYLLFVDAEIRSVDPAKIPYVPDDVALISLANSWRSQVSKLSLEVHIDTRYGALVRKKVESLLLRRLGMKAERGDRFSFVDLDVRLPKRDDELEVELLRSDSEVRGARSRLDSLSQERSADQIELEKLRSELGKVMTQDEIAAIVKGGATGSVQQGASDHQINNFLEANALAVLLCIAAVFLSGILLFALVLRSGTRIMGHGLMSIGENLPLLGDKIGGPLSERTTLMEQPRLNPAATDARDPHVPVLSQVSAGQLDLLYNLNLRLRDDLLAILNEQNEHVVLQSLCQLLDTRQMAKAVSLLEIFGKQKTIEIFKKLGVPQQNLIMEFIKNGQYDRPKAELMHEVGEQIKTRLLAAQWRPQGQEIDNRITELTLKLRTNDLLAVVMSITREALPRLILYIEPHHLAEVLKEVKVRDSSRFLELIKMTTLMPEAQKQNSFDREIFAALTSNILKSDGDGQQQYFSYYRTLVENADESIVGELNEIIAQSSPQLGAFLRDHVITFATFFYLKRDYQEQILVALSNREVASLLISLSDDVQVQIRKRIDERRIVILEEEIDNANARNSLQQNAASRAVKDKIVEQIRAFKTELSMSDLIEGTDNDALPMHRGNRGQGAA